MTIRLLIGLSFALLFGQNAQGQNINIDLSKLFFNIDVSELDNSLPDKFSRDTSLKKSEGSIDTAFYPRSREFKYIVQHNFAFKTNSYLKFPFVDGNLGVIVGKDYSNKDNTVIFLAFEFTNNSYLDSGYLQILESFKNFGQLETKTLFDEIAVITNTEYNRRLEIIKVRETEHHMLYVYLKRLTK